MLQRGLVYRHPHVQRHIWIFVNRVRTDGGVRISLLVKDKQSVEAAQQQYSDTCLNTAIKQLTEIKIQNCPEGAIHTYTSKNRFSLVILF